MSGFWLLKWQRSVLAFALFLGVVSGRLLSQMGLDFTTSTSSW